MSERVFKNTAQVEYRQNRGDDIISLRKPARCKLVNRRRKHDSSDPTLPHGPLKRPRTDLDPVQTVTAYLDTVHDILDNNISSGVTLEETIHNLRVSISAISTEAELRLLLTPRFAEVIIDRTFLVARPIVKYEILWMLVNITAVIGGHDLEVLFASSRVFLLHLPTLLTCKRVDDVPVNCLACWLIGNISNTSPVLRCSLINQNALDRIVALGLADDYADKEFLSIQAWALGSLLHGTNPPVPHSTAVNSLPRLFKLLDHPSETIQTDVLRSLTSYSEYAERTELLMTPSFTSKLVTFVSSPTESISNSALLITGNVISGSEVYAIMLLKAGLFKILRQHLTSKTGKLELIWWCIENICAGSSNTFYFMLTNNDVMLSLLDTIQSGPHAAQQHAIKALVNIVMNSERPTVVRLFQTFDVVEGLTRCLEYPDMAMVEMILSALGRLYNIIDRQNSIEMISAFVDRFESLDGMTELDKISNSCESDSVAAQAAKLLELFQSSAVMDY